MEYEKSPDNIFYRMMMDYAHKRWAYFDDLLQQVGRFSPNSEELNFLTGKHYKDYLRYYTLWLHYDSYDISCFQLREIQ